MVPPLEHHPIENHLRISQTASFIAIGAGILVLLGWLLHMAPLKSIMPGAATMKPNAALCFMLSGVSLLLWWKSSSSGQSRKRIIAAQLLAGIVFLIALLTLSQDLLGIDLGIDMLLFSRTLAATGLPNPGRMSPITSLNFVLLGTSLLFLAAKSHRRYCPSQYLALTTAFVGLVASLGYIYGAPELYQFSSYSPIALLTSLLFSVLGIGVLFACADHGLMESIMSRHVGGMMARRILPVTILLPFVVGWLRLQGERAGLYETEFGLALFATSNIVLFTLVIWLSARSLNSMEEKRIQVEKALSDRERRFRALTERSSDAIVMMDRDLNILYNSPSVASIEGYTEEELLGRHADDHTHPDDLPMLQKIFQQILANPGRPIPLQWRRRHKDGRWLWLEGVATNLLDDPAVGAVVTNYRDITDRKLAEEGLRESEERFSKAFRSSPAGMAFLRLEDLCYIDANESWLKMIGYEREEVVGHTAAELGVTDPKDREERLQRIKGHGGVSNEDVTLRTKRGEFRQFLVSSQIVMVGSEPYLMTVYVDITERKRAEEARTRLEEQLLQSQKMEALGTLASGIAHDFNNILTAIVGNTKLARQDLPTEHPVQRNLKEVYDAGTRAADLVRRILAFSRQQGTNRRLMKLAPVIEEALQLLRATLPAKVEIRTEIPDDLPDVLADPVQIHQVIMNLGTNAAYALGEQGGLLEVQLDAVTVDAELARAYAELHEGEYVRLSVRDNGCGMEPAVVQRIFEPFFTTKEPGKGTGLGLSVVHGIVQNHGGGMTVYSEPGQGTAFNLYFPATKGTAVVAPPEEEEETRGNGEHLLYVDDEVALVTLFTMTLQRLGYQVTGQKDPTKALEIFRSRPHDFDAVVTDLSMPGMSGPELARKLLEIRPDIPIVLMSGYIPDTEMELARRIGIRAFISKPATMESLERTLHELLRTRS